MKRNIHLAVFFALLACFVCAANAQPVPVYTFTCTGTQGVGPCPDGGRPYTVVQGSDGNFYATAENPEVGPNAGAGMSFRLPLAECIPFCTLFFPDRRTTTQTATGRVCSFKALTASSTARR